MNQKFIKTSIPKELREQTWLRYNGKRFETKCYIKWCVNKIDVFNFHVGHDVPESKGGLTVIENLRPICAKCNLSMSNNYTIDEWNGLGKKTTFLQQLLCVCKIQLK